MSSRTGPIRRVGCGCFAASRSSATRSGCVSSRKGSSGRSRSGRSSKQGAWKGRGSSMRGRSTPGPSPRSFVAGRSGRPLARSATPPGSASAARRRRRGRRRRRIAAGTVHRPRRAGSFRASRERGPALMRQSALTSTTRPARQGSPRYARAWPGSRNPSGPHPRPRRLHARASRDRGPRTGCWQGG